MPVQSSTIAAVTHGRYLVRALSRSGPHPLLVGFHGYGENAELHLEHLSHIPGSDNWLLVAIEGLHRFYTAGADKVVASWMTRQDRELAIGDNIRYVASVVEQVKLRHRTSALVYVGFSQGVAMAYRAAAHAGHACRGLIALGGDVPPEISNDQSVRLPAILLARGKYDERYRADQLASDGAYLALAASTLETVCFDGGHEWAPPFLEAAGRFLARLR